MSVSKTKFQTLFFEHLSGVCFVNITISDNRKFFPFCVQGSMYIAPWSFFSLSKIIVLSFNSAANLHNCLNSSLTSCYELNNILFVVRTFMDSNKRFKSSLAAAKCSHDCPFVSRIGITKNNNTSCSKR